MAEPVVRKEGKKVYRSTIDRMNAASITRKVAFHSPTCQSAFSKGFYIVSRNLWFVSVLGPILVGEEKSAAAEKIIMQSVKKLNESVLKQEALLREVVKGYGYKETATFPKPYEFDADVYHPVAIFHKTESNIDGANVWSKIIHAFFPVNKSTIVHSDAPLASAEIGLFCVCYRLWMHLFLEIE